MRFIKNITLSFILIALTHTAMAQVFPVQGNAALIPPYSVYLSDYTSRTNDRLLLNIVLNDMARPELAVRLRLKIQGQNINIETKPEYIGSAINLQGGIPLRLNGTDLIEYFNPNNLNFSGITRKEFEKTGALPQGFYQFCFEVLEYNRGVKISNTICAPGWLILNDPPIVNLPRNNEKLKPTLPQNVIFQWTPRHTGSPNSAFSTEYELTMVEVWPATRNPNDAILTSPPILETTTRSTSFIYGPAETPLEPGRRYAFRVKAKSIVGAEEFDLFKNNGYSEVYSFVYGDACGALTDIKVGTIGSSRFNVSWAGQFNHTAYNLRYREAGTTEWYENTSIINEIEVSKLKPLTTYEYQVSGTCGILEGQYSTVAKIKTKETPATIYSCGVPPETFTLDPAQLAGSLNAGDIIQAGDFAVTLSKVSGSNGVFTGEGVIEVPYFNKAKVKIEFDNITVNKELRMVNGALNVTGAGVDVIPSGVMDLMDDLTETLDVLDSALTTIEQNLPEHFDPHSFVPDTLIAVKEGISSVYKDTDGTIVIVDAKGNEQRLPAGTTAAVTDGSGNGYLVDKKGTVHKTTAEVAAKAGKKEYNLLVKFAEDPQAIYGFDEKEHDALAKYYEQLKDGYYVAWKAVEAGKTDPVIASLQNNSIDKTRIRFEMGGMQVQTPPIGNSQTTTVLVPGKTDGEVEDLIVMYSLSDTGKQQVLGKLKVVSYNKINKEVVIVPVNGATLPASKEQIQFQLNAIYNQAAVNWDVSIMDSIRVALPTPFDDGQSGLLTNYTSDMKAVINAYKTNMVADKFYLFLISNPKSGRNALGYMPRSKQAGFIFAANHQNANDLSQTIAHELGHGAFNLSHTFNEEKFTLGKGTTDNLMDYPGGAKLYKYQWDQIRYPSIIIGLFEDDEDSERKKFFRLDFSEFNLSGHTDILIFLLNEKAAEMIRELDVHQYSKNNTETRQHLADDILLNVLGSSKIKLGDPGESLSLVEAFIDLYVKHTIAKHHDKLVYLMQTSSGDKRLTYYDYLRTAVDWGDRLVNFGEPIEKLYNDVYIKYSELSNQNLSAFKTEISEMIIRGEAPLTSNGIKNLLMKMSNTKIKELLRWKLPSITNSEIAKIIAQKNAGKYFDKIDDLVDELKPKDLTNIISKTDDLIIANLKDTPSNLAPELGPKFRTAKLEMVGSMFDLFEIADLMRTPDNIDVGKVFDNIIGILPVGGAALYAYMFRRIVDDWDEQAGKLYWENGQWNMIQNWEKGFRNKHGLPNDFVYVYYTDEPDRVNPYVIPTSIIITDKDLATKIFGFTPRYVNCNFKHRIEEDGDRVKFIPDIQVDYVK